MRVSILASENISFFWIIIPIILLSLVNLLTGAKRRAGKIDDNMRSGKSILKDYDKERHDIDQLSR